MKYRATEILFRHKLLVLLPALVVVCATGALAVRPQPAQWQSFGTVWVDPYKPLTQDGVPTTATTQAQLINDFIHTRSFAVAVLQQTTLAPLLATPASQATLTAQFQRWTKAVASGSFVTIVASTPDPNMSLTLATGVLSTFQSILQQQTNSKVQAALNVYGGALKTAQTTLTQAQNDLASYIRAHPELTQPGAEGDLASRDPAYATLLNQLNTAQGNYDALQQQIASAQQSGLAGEVGLPFSFTVVDEPQLAPDAVRPSRLGLIKLPGIGLVVGLLLSSAVAAVLILTNRTVLGAPSVQATLPLPVLGEVRSIRGYRWPWQRGGSGHAGSKLPWHRKPRQSVRLNLAAAARLSGRDSGGI